MQIVEGRLEVGIVQMYGLFSPDGDYREEQQRCASSWGWPEECRFRDPVQQQPATAGGVCTVFVLLCRCCVSLT